MSWFRRLTNLTRSAGLSREIESEMKFHLEERVDELVAEGMTEAEALREARRSFGNVALHRERTREADLLGWLESVLTDLRYAARALRSSPAFTAAAVLSLAVGIGANTAIFSLLDAVLLRSLPIREPQEVVQVMAGDDPVFTNPTWEEIRDREDVFAGVFAVATKDFDLAGGGEARMVPGSWISGGFFGTLGASPALGRLLGPSDDVRGCAPTAVISHRLWKSEFGGAADVVGRSISLDGHPFSIVGVARASFFGVHVGRHSQVYAPLCAIAAVAGEASSLDERRYWFLEVLARRRPELTASQTAQRLAALAPSVFAASMPAEWPEELKRQYLQSPLKVSPAATGLSKLRLQYREPLLVLMAVVGLVLLIACANVANLLLARAAARQREMAVRVAIGASRGRVARQMLTESLLLATVGAAVGVAAAHGGTGILARYLAWRDQGMWLDLGLDLRVLGFTLAVTTATGLLFGIMPAWRSSRADPQAALRGSRNESGTSASPRTARALVIAQFALSLVLLMTAGLLLGSFRSLNGLDPGFDADGVLLVNVEMKNARFAAEQRPLVQHQLLDRLRAIPGVRSASASFMTPIGGRAWNGELLVDGFTPADRDDGIVWFNGVSDGYFATVGTALRAGRDFRPGDGEGAPRVAIVDQAVARKFFGEASPLGKRFRVDAGPEDEGPFEIVGVVEEAKYQSLREETSATVYLSTRQQKPIGSRTTFAVRTTGPPTAAIPQIQAAILEADPRITLRFGTLSAQVTDSLRPEILLAALSGFFGAVALFLAGVGLYGTLAYSVARRRTEIGIRVALGAGQRRVVGTILQDVARMLAPGLLIGIVGALAASRLVATFLYGVTPRDPGTLAFSALILTLTALAAGAWPAWRAARVDPRVALQSD